MQDMSLREPLDRIWKAPASARDVAKAELLRFSPDQWLVLAAVDVGAAFMPGVRGSITLGEREQAFAVTDPTGSRSINCTVTLDRNSPGHDSSSLAKPIVVFRSFDVRVWSSEPITETQEPLQHDASTVLFALQMIRDHLDSVILHPPELRTREIEEFASRADLSPEFFLELARWFPAIERLAR